MSSSPLANWLRKRGEGVQSQFVTTDLDTLATALYVKIDDLLKAAPHLAPWRPRVGITPKLSDAELVTLAVMQALLGFVSETRWLRHSHAHLRHLFPYLPQQSGYNKRLRRAAGLIRQVIRELATDTALWSDDVWVVDSTPRLLRQPQPLLLGTAAAPGVHPPRPAGRLRPHWGESRRTGGPAGHVRC